MEIDDIVEGVIACDHRAIARAISLVERGSSRGPAVIRRLFDRAGSARLVGVTGAPGVGKSTLVDALTTTWRRSGRRVGVLAVDPSSPFTGGAILGDRIRMQAHSGDQGVFVRSMAARGRLGGVARATSDAAVVLDAAGLDVVLIETVGVGQGEVDIARTADVSVVVTVPGTGDDVQALKAGIMEIGDVFVVNKADRDGADRAVGEIESALALDDRHEPLPLVLKTVATTGEGVPEVLQAITDRGDHGGDRRHRLRQRADVRLRDALNQHFGHRLQERPGATAAIDAAVDRIARNELDPYTAAKQIMEGLI